MFFEILKASKGLYTDNIFAEMWGKRLAGQEEWQVTEITGYLPLTFLANGDVLQTYRLYGTENGAGVETESGEPAGYKIPLTNTSGVTSADYNLYIGSTKLGEEEYVDYGEQKIYKDVSGTLTPTDPPQAFPAITAYQGENTLSSTETVGEVTVRGRIAT